MKVVIKTQSLRLNFVYLFGFSFGTFSDDTLGLISNILSSIEGFHCYEFLRSLDTIIGNIYRQI